jgi:molybdopterin synthase sulfur carrier subunit
MASTGIPTEGSSAGTLVSMAIVRLFAAAREAAGTGRDEVPGATVGDVLGEASRRYGERFSEVLATCKIWVNGEPADRRDAIGAGDELAVLPPVSGGSVAEGQR